MGNSFSVSAVQEHSWVGACANATRNLTEGLVDVNGRPTSGYNNSTWGITHKVCYDVCGPDKMYQAFIFKAFAIALPTWLLPWIALAAQLPYEASGPGSNVMSCLLALGSPALITYSLSLTILNRYWIQRRLAGLKKACQRVDHLAHMSGRINAAGELLQDAQQVPLRVSQEHGWLNSLIVLPENQSFWELVESNLRITRVGPSASLFAQMLLASIAYFLVIVNTFLADLGDHHVAFQLASSSLWAWMIPVILGWILVGTQSGADAISRAICKSYIRKGVAESQRGITVLSDEPDEPEKSDKWFGCNVAGDEREAGPIYNYSRVFTWFQCANQIAEGFSRELEKCKNGTHESTQEPEPTQQELLLEPKETIISAYLPWSKVPARAWRHIVFASIVALFVQWGTTGPAIMIAYLTPTRGLSCRSGSYLLYGSAATMAWALLACSSFLSHAIMLRRGAEQRTVGYTLRFLAVCTRYLGKIIAVMNAGWLILFCLLEYIGTFDTCWCATGTLSKGSRGFAGIFGRTTATSGAVNYWAGSLALSLSVCSFSLAFFYLATGHILAEGDSD